jgi:hypothetical protein
MRKRLITPQTENASATESPSDSSYNEQDWLDLDSLTEVELTSEDSDHPIESALIAGSDHGWRAAQSGEQAIRLFFTEPQAIKHIRLLFHESARERTQQFTLRWSDDGGQTYHEIVRQQYNFNPSDSTRELEDYQVELDRVTTLELKMIPDISGGDAIASLEQLQLA